MATPQTPELPDPVASPEPKKRFASNQSVRIPRRPSRSMLASPGPSDERIRERNSLPIFPPPQPPSTPPPKSPSFHFPRGPSGSGAASTPCSPSKSAIGRRRVPGPARGNSPEHRKLSEAAAACNKFFDMGQASGYLSARYLKFSDTLETLQQESEEAEQPRRALTLPLLAQAAPRNMPSFKSTGRLRHALLERPNDVHPDLEDEPRLGNMLPVPAAEAPAPAQPTGPGPGGSPSHFDKAYYKPREDDVLHIAVYMGMVRKEMSLANMAVLRNPKPRAENSSATVFQVSPLGINMSVLTRLLSDLPAELSIRDLVNTCLIPQTKKLGCRYIDLVPDKYKDSPGYYLINSWNMSFRTFVESLKQYFALTKQAESDTVIWVNFLCLNLHREVGPAELVQIGEVLKTVDKYIFIMDPKGTCFQQTWIQYSLWQTYLQNRHDRVVVLPTSPAWRDMFLGYITMDVATSICTSAKERALMVQDMQRGNEMGKLVDLIKEMVVKGAKREMNRAEKMSSVNPRRYTESASCYAMFLYFHARYTEAEDVMRGVKAAIDKASSRDIQASDEARCAVYTALILRDRGLALEAQRILLDFASHFRDLSDDIYLEGVSVLVDLLCALKSFTKAEMQCRKNVELHQRKEGANSPGVINSLLQMSAISIAQKLYEEAEKHVLQTLKLVLLLEGPDGLSSASCYHLLCICYYYSNRHQDAQPLMERALHIRQQRLGPDHPQTLESKFLKAMILMDAQKLLDAEHLIHTIHTSRLRVFGADHPDTLETLGLLADLQRSLRKYDEADMTEKRIMECGRYLLKQSRMDKLKSLQFISLFLTKRAYLLEKAAMFLAKAFVVLREKLGPEAELTLDTKQKLLDIISNERDAAVEALEEAELFHRPDKYQDAEMLFKQAWSMSKLIKPEDEHQALAQGLTDALFGQGKVQEAKSVMRAAGLIKKGMQQNMPSSYLRWLNKRVAKYMDQRTDGGGKGEGEGDEEGGFVNEREDEGSEV